MIVVFPMVPGQGVGKVYLPEGHWEEFQKAPERIAQINADKISYAWDELIEKFNFYAMRGEQHFVTSGGIKDAEKVLRFMAREPRWKRRYLAQSIIEMLHTTPVDKRRLRVLPPVDIGDPYFVFLLLPMLPGNSYAQYRSERRYFLESCCAVAKLEYPEALDIVGIATNPGGNFGSRSEDAIYFDGRGWNAEMEANARLVQEELGILKNPRRVEEYMQEYPDVPSAGPTIKNARNKPCPCGSGRKYKHCCLKG
jgi:hypothetical protein